jgi:hypothetical protein
MENGNPMHPADILDTTVTITVPRKALETLCATAAQQEARYSRLIEGDDSTFTTRYRDWRDQLRAARAAVQAALPAVLAIVLVTLPVPPRHAMPLRCCVAHPSHIRGLRRSLTATDAMMSAYALGRLVQA